MDELRHQVLIVADDPGIREALAECVATMGLDVATAAGGREGLERLRGARLPSALLLDVALPDLDGERFLAAMRANPRAATVPVIAMTASKEPLAEPVRKHLEKPFDLDEIAKALSRLCGPRS